MGAGIYPSTPPPSPTHHSLPLPSSLSGTALDFQLADLLLHFGHLGPGLLEIGWQSAKIFGYFGGHLLDDESVVFYVVGFLLHQRIVQPLHLRVLFL